VYACNRTNIGMVCISIYNCVHSMLPTGFPMILLRNVTVRAVRDAKHFLQQIGKKYGLDLTKRKKIWTCVPGNLGNPFLLSDCLSALWLAVGVPIQIQGLFLHVCKIQPTVSIHENYICRLYETLCHDQEDKKWFNMHKKVLLFLRQYITIMSNKW
jgi:hypothetical protein